MSKAGSAGIGKNLARIRYTFVCSRGCRDKYMFSQTFYIFVSSRGVQEWLMEGNNLKFRDLREKTIDKEVMYNNRAKQHLLQIIIFGRKV